LLTNRQTPLEHKQLIQEYKINKKPSCR